MPPSHFTSFASVANLCRPPVFDVINPGYIAIDQLTKQLLLLQVQTAVAHAIVVLAEFRVIGIRRNQLPANIIFARAKYREPVIGGCRRPGFRQNIDPGVGRCNNIRVSCTVLQRAVREYENAIVRDIAVGWRFLHT